MYTEIFVNVDLIEETPDEVINVLKAIVEKDMDSPYLKNRPGRWCLLFNNTSSYFPQTEAHVLEQSAFSGRYSLLGKGDIKNYENEIGQFFVWLMPWCEPGFIGYHRYEEDIHPQIVIKEG